MFVDFNSLPDSSRIWIYQSSRLMNENEVQLILEQGKAFIDSWTAHKAELNAGLDVISNAFLIFAVDETFSGASGCSIDKKVNFVQQLEQITGAGFFNRMNIAFETSDESISIVHLNKLNDLMVDGKLNLQSIVYNNMVNTLGELRNSWKVKLSDSWMMNFVDKDKV
jgi:hypothetical protein